MNHPGSSAVNLGNIHPLFEGKESEPVNAASDVRIKDALGVRSVISAVVRFEGVLHEILDPFEIVGPGFTNKGLALRHASSFAGLLPTRVGMRRPKVGL